MNPLQRRFCFLASFLGTALLLWLTLRSPDSQQDLQRRSANLHREIDRLNEDVARLERLLGSERERLKKMQEDVDEHMRLQRWQQEKAKQGKLVRGSLGGWPDPIGVLVFVCNRADAIREHLGKLIRYRTSKHLFPIIVSQDCDNQDVADVAKSFGDQITYLKHVSGENANIDIPASHKQYTTYYRISRHYKLGLEHVFNEMNLGSVIITEDDLDIAPDFFDYFSGTRWLLEQDPTLYCVSAWNDNGKADIIDQKASQLLYRSDFFPGLGWLMTKQLWKELGPQWPTGFWDDWIRDPARRKERGCIRPEVPRTAMTAFGKAGASKGLFFNRHLKRIILNQQPANFSRIPLDYLLKDNYDGPFLDRIYSLPNVSLEGVIAKTLQPGVAGQSFRVEYASMGEYTEAARRLHIMIDTKAGVPRTAYRGVVTCFISGVRIYLAPTDREHWSGYNVKWEPPAELPDQE